ncbi:MAG: sigma 54-interacting transcriptional regulator [Planctomycetes bacterium]|nr:sigma 54-interacting transcriptional regulator [Planctomycetota bacterium]
MKPIPSQSADVRGKCDGDVPPSLNPADTPELLAEDSALAALLKSVASTSGENRFRTIARCLAQALGVKYAIVAEFLPEKASVRSLAFWIGDRFIDNAQWGLAGTPCERVLEGKFSLHSKNLQQEFPLDKPLIDLKAESYLGVPLIDQSGSILGHLFVMDTRPMPPVARNLAIFQVFAALAAGELARLRLEASLAESQERFRDLFDEAPIAYVHEGLDSRFIRANRAALRILGVKPEEVLTTFGRDLVPQTPEAQKRLREAFESIGRGTDTSGVVLELRRKDNNKPIWIQWWSKPDGAGTYTRTMFVDITERVLMEQEQARLRTQNKLLREEIKSAHNFDEIVGASPALMKVLENVDRVAPTDSTVLIQGETGTGKELIARAIHERSQRRSGPFVKVNCAALPAGLVESEFFGHEKGAFTGAVNSRRGRFELADGGTIFLDEVGEVAPDVQVKLLRVLQENEFERVGGSETIRVNVRVIAATNRDLPADVQAQRFRADLFYRLSVFPMAVPPLRDRVVDIPMLASYFVTQIAASVGKRIDEIDADTMDRLSRYAWPGNIRELRNVLERAVILCDGKSLRIAASELPSAGTPASSSNLLSLDDMERQHIAEVLKQTNGAIAGPGGAAKILGVPPSTLRSRMARLGLK